MPKVTIWIREEDYDKWQNIKDKPAWLHGHLALTTFGATKAVPGSFKGFETHGTTFSLPTEPKLTPP